MFRKKRPVTLLYLTTLPLTSFINPKSPPQKHALRIIVIDAGHGLPDGGNHGRISNESDVSLDIALKLGKKLQDSLPDCIILYTRTDQHLPGGLTNHNEANRWRARFANESHGDLFICIHCNAAEDHHSEFVGYTYEKYKVKGKTKKKKVKKYRYYTTLSAAYGTETYVWAVDKNDSKKSFVNSTDTVDTGGEKADSSFNYFDSPEARILASLKTKKYFDNSLLLAEYVEEEFVKDGRQSRGVKQRNDEGIWVLQATAMPSILVETGFLSNKTEEEYLNSENGQEEVSNSITRAVLRYNSKITGGRSNK